MRKYYFEYDKSGYLFKYKESNVYNLLLEKYNSYMTNCKEQILSYCFLSGRTVTKIEENGKFKNFIEYNSPIMFKHRFEAGESWLSVEGYSSKIDIYKKNKVTKEDEHIERRYPEFYFDKDLISPTTKEGIIKEIRYNYKKYPTIKKQLCLEDNKIYNIRIKIKESKLNKWKTLIDF